MDIYEANRRAWNNEASRHNFWTIMVREEQIEKARQGNPGIWVTPFKTVPLDWIEDLKGKEVLLACGGGGQQTPILAAFGSIVTTLDISDSQIRQPDPTGQGSPGTVRPQRHSGAGQRT